MQKAQLTTTEAALNFLRGGNATFTLVSSKSGERFTFKAVQKKEDMPVWISLLRGPDNTSDFSFIGSLFSDGNFCHGSKAKVSASAPSAKAAKWICETLESGNENAFAKVEFWHEGRCGCCGRKLTVPESIASGIGPVCAGKMG